MKHTADRMQSTIFTLHRSIVSFSFDDAPESAFLRGGQILEDHGFRGTYYVSAGKFGGVSEIGKIGGRGHVDAAFSKGHEIGNHTYAHVDCSNVSVHQLWKNIRKNKQVLRHVISDSFAYPFGAHNWKARLVVRLCGLSGRTVEPGINRGRIDFARLKANRIYHNLGLRHLCSLVEECRRTPGWLIFYTHDVSSNPSPYGCTEEELASIVALVKQQELLVLPVGSAVRLLRSRSAVDTATSQGASQ